jgi:predicted PurR-regulated permease PerM
MGSNITIIVVYLVIWLAIMLPPVIRILDRVGHNRWWAVLAFIPLVNLAGVWWLAFGEWPAMQPPSPRQMDQWSDADNKKFKELLRERGL